MSVSRSMMALSGIVVLGMALTACTEKQALGTIEARHTSERVEKITNPGVDGCHRFSAAVTHVANWTQSDIVLYPTADCTEPRGGASVYLATQTQDGVVPSEALWRSYTVVN
ncbi:hypothetical protein [Streptomyces griseus]|uniref:hypothetical protein n=1 Tax=Streptomyces griseus TaxID=1911 RepID=UPI00056145BF|nr:hypothetical protein [Streptomyces griseus]